MTEDVGRRLSSMGITSAGSGGDLAGTNVYYVTNFILESQAEGHSLISSVDDAIPIIVSTFENGSRRTEQLELKKQAKGKWYCSSAYRFYPSSPSVSIQIGPSGRLGGLSLPVGQLVCTAGSSISRSLSLSIRANTRARFKLTCDVSTSQSQSPDVADPLQSLQEHATECYSRFKSSKDVSELLDAIKALTTVTERTRSGDSRLITWMNDLGVYTLLAFDQVLDLDLLPLSGSYLQRALSSAIESNPRVVPALQSNTAVALMRLFQSTMYQQSDYIEEAIRILRLAAQKETSDLPNDFLLLTMRESFPQSVPEALLSSDIPNSTALYFDNLHHAFMYQFIASDDPSDLQEASSAQVAAITATAPESRPLLSTRSHRLGTTLIRQVRYFNVVECIDEAVFTLQTAVSHTPTEDPSLPNRLSDLVDALVTRFILKEDLEDIEAAIAHQRRALELTPEDAPRVQLATWWDALGSCYYYRYDRAGKVGDLDEAIRSHQKSVELTDDGDPALLVRLSNLGVPFMSRFEHLGNLSDANEAIKIQEQAVDLSPEGDPNLPTRLNNLGISMMQRFHHANEEEDLIQAIKHHQRSIALTPPNDPEMSTRLHNLVISLNFQLDLHPNPDDLDVAISTEERAIELVSEGNPNLPTWLNNLGSLLNRRADNSGSLSDLESGISAHARAVEATPADHPDLPIWWSNLGSAYRNKFIHTGDIDALQESISVLQRSVKMTPSDHADLPGWLNNLSSALGSRFSYTGDKEDIEEAIEVAREALEVVPTHRIFLRATSLHNLGTTLMVHFTRFSIEEELVESITCLKEAISLLPEEHAERPTSMRVLADAQMVQFEHFGMVDSLQAAIENLDNVVRNTTEGQVMHDSHLAGLGLALAKRFELIGDEADWKKSIENHTRAMELTPPDHPDMTLRYNDLGYSHLARHRRLGEKQSLEDAVANFRKAATWKAGTWMTRLMAAREWAKYAPSISPYEALDAYKTSVDLVSVAAGLRFTIQRRHQHLLETADISRAAAAIALSVGKVEQALEWLEQGRGLVWSQLSQLRAPIEVLRARDPELAERFLSVSKGLENAGAQLASASSSLEEKMVLQKRTGEQGKYAKEWEELLAAIRAIPEFENFLLPPPSSSLVSTLPHSGYAVVINVHPDRCDAIALRGGFNGGKPLHIPLSSFSFKKAESLHALLRKNLAEAGVLTRGDVLGFERRDEDGETEEAEAGEGGSSRGLRVFRNSSTGRKDTVEQVLRDLWTLLVRPIVTELSLERTPSPTTRIWWCTTGVVSFLPIHAAGIYRGTDIGALSEYAVSSYIPTVGMLTERARHTPKEHPGLLLVSQPDVPGMSRIPGTIAEVELIHKRAESAGVKAYCIESDNEANPEALMKSMQQYSCIHLACHASQSTREPLASGFYLHGGCLQLSTIIQAHLTSADIAFLSACQTSTGDEDLSEEAVHLAAGMMAAGYRGVVAAMWSIQDRHGAQVADDFYGDLFARSASEQGIDGSKAAYSLHHSVQKLRKQLGVSEVAFLAWVPYVHFGL